MGAPSYEGKQVYRGLDVHREFFVTSCICDGGVVKRCRMPGAAEAVIWPVTKEFSGASVLAAYEAGYSGFWLCRKLVEAGIECLPLWCLPLWYHPTISFIESNFAPIPSMWQV